MSVCGSRGCVDDSVCVANMHTRSGSTSTHHDACDGIGRVRGPVAWQQKMNTDYKYRVAHTDEYRLCGRLELIKCMVQHQGCKCTHAAGCRGTHHHAYDRIRQVGRPAAWQQKRT